MDFRGSLYSRRIIIKTDVNGEVLWNSVSSFIGKSGSYINPVLNIGYIVTGNIKSYGLYQDRYLDLVDLNGNTIWSKGGNGDGEGLTANVLSDSSYIWSYGNTPYHQPTQYFITKYDKNGGEIFSKLTTRIQAIVESFDNRILLTGGIGGANSVGDISILKVDSGGNKIWDTTFSGANYNGNEAANHVILSSDSSYVLVGTTTSYQNNWDSKIILLKYKETGISAVPPEEISLNDFKLNQNYPNPFNPSTKISWQSPVSGWQTLKIYDVLGNEIATLVNEFRSAGSYEVEFKSTVGNRQPAYRTGRLANGVYFYQLQIGDYVETKKMILLK
ncbi:MAG TPA: hypothetical protein DHV28_09565 [Ignavibacteriales bacterium]|nr:hypothetical protein [Ignavibacteriales bacterium]